MTEQGETDAEHSVTQQNDVEIVSHYADEDGLECVQALLLLLAGYHPRPKPTKQQ